MSSTWNKLVNLVIRPPRAQYDPNEHLPGPRFRIAGVTHVRRDVDIEGADGLTLKCSHYEPEVRGDDPLPCVIYLHGNSGSRCDATEAIRLLLPARITVFAVDLGGSGMSEGEYVTLGVRETTDVECIVNHLRDQGLTSKIGLWGTSMGAVTAIMYASRDPSIAGLVLDSPFSSLPKLMLELVSQFTKGSRVGVPKMAARMALSFVRSSVKSRAKFDINDLDLKKIAPATFCPALFAHGKDDDFIPPHHSETLHELYAGDKNYIAIDGDHNSPRPAFFFDSTVIFFCNVLDPPATTYSAGAIGRGAATLNSTLNSNPHPAVGSRNSLGIDVTRRGSPAPVEFVRRRHQPREEAREDEGASESENVATLVSMGFDERGAKAALRQGGGDVEAAVAALLTGGDGAGEGGGGGAGGGGGGGGGAPGGRTGPGGGGILGSVFNGFNRHYDGQAGGGTHGGHTVPAGAQSLDDSRRSSTGEIFHTPLVEPRRSGGSDGSRGSDAQASPQFAGGIRFGDSPPSESLSGSLSYGSARPWSPGSVSKPLVRGGDRDKMSSEMLEAMEMTSDADLAHAISLSLQDINLSGKGGDGKK
jgi:pimeloyl-ACP methyl ester carboxylesterase